MKQQINRLLSSTVTGIVLLGIYALLLAIATFIEKYYGTDVAKSAIYLSPLLIAIQALMIINFCCLFIKHRKTLNKKAGVLCIHFAFIIILLGAAASHFFGKEGSIHLREGETTNSMIVQNGNSFSQENLPFKITLDDFYIERYPGSMSPSSYESFLTVDHNGLRFKTEVYMNNILNIDGYRIFQTSFDKDEEGSVLSVNHDIWGHYLTYIGYFILFVGLILSLTIKNSRFRTLSRLLNIFILLLLPISGFSQQNNVKKVVINPEFAAKFASLPMQFDGRMVPVNTFSRQLLMKLHKSSEIYGMNSDCFLISAMAFPEEWAGDKFILNGKGYASFIELLDTNGYFKYNDKIRDIYSNDASKRTAQDKDLLKLDERCNIVNSIFNMDMLRIFPMPNDKNHRWYAPGEDLSSFSGMDSLFVTKTPIWLMEEIRNAVYSGDWSQANKVLDMLFTYQNAKNTGLDIRDEVMQREINYNKLDIFNTCKKAYLIFGGLALILSILLMFKPKTWKKILFITFSILIFGAFIYHTYGMWLRWQIGGYAPWSNSYETMTYAAWTCCLGGLLFIRKSNITFALASLLSGVMLFVASLNWMDPQIGTIVPVLKSPWLMFHVAVIVAAYGFLGICFFIGLTNQILMICGSKIENIKRLTIINEMAMLIGLALMTIGTFLGAIWANESWGRYWGWDPKETWALITMLIYAIVLHIRLINKKYSLWAFNTAGSFAFLTVLMTYFGVNYFLSGMHSYGASSSPDGFLYIALCFVASLIIIAVVAKIKSKKQII